MRERDRERRRFPKEIRGKGKSRQKLILDDIENIKGIMGNDREEQLQVLFEIEESQLTPSPVKIIL